MYARCHECKNITPIRTSRKDYKICSSGLLLVYICEYCRNPKQVNEEAVSTSSKALPEIRLPHAFSPL
jgi:hypothetical protein